LPISISIFTKKSFDDFIKNEGASWIQKAKDAHAILSIAFSNNNLAVGRKPNAYDAAIAADYVSHRLLDMDSIFTFETVLSHHSKINFLEAARNRAIKPIFILFVRCLRISMKQE
jgi:predicted ABC-type ATPase